MSSSGPPPATGSRAAPPPRPRQLPPSPEEPASGRQAGATARPVATLLLAALMAVVLVGSAVASGRSGPANPAGAAAAEGPVAASAPAASSPMPHEVTYGLAEPAGTLPGVETPADRAAWSQIRADVVGSGACWLRSDLDTWLTNAIETFDWLGSPSSCTSSAGSPVKVLAILDQQTVWAARRLCPDVAFSATYRARHNSFTLDDWRQLVRCIAQRFAGRISAYEIWNEPLLDNSMMGYQDGSAAHYADLLRTADAEIKAADPRAAVLALGGSDLYAGGDQARLDAMRSFSISLLALGAANDVDGISLHAYPWGHDDGAVWTSYQDELRFQQDAWGKPVWITETGERATDAMTQATYLRTAYGLFTQAGVQAIFWFSITDQPDGEFGLRGRPVEAALRDFALGHGADGADGALLAP